MNTILKFACIGLCLMLFTSAEAENAYTLGLRVGNGQLESKSSKKGGGGGRSGTQTKTVKASKTWPVSVSCRGKERPAKLTLNVFYIGTRNGSPLVMKKETIDVDLDEKGDFKRDLESPTAELVKVTTRTQSGGGRGGHHGGNHGGGSVSTKTKTTGDRVTGCIVQLMDGSTVAKSFASNPSWAKLAKTDPLPEEEVLKFR